MEPAERGEAAPTRAFAAAALAIAGLAFSFTPLADRLRPKRMEEVVGQDHLLKPDGPIGRMVAQGRLASMVLWGPPGSGKTTIARLLAEHTDLEFQPLSAVFSGVADLRKVFDQARKLREAGRGTLLFVDEIHRFNRAQQDSFLPYVEDGAALLGGLVPEDLARRGMGSALRAPGAGWAWRALILVARTPGGP